MFTDSDTCRTAFQVASYEKSTFDHDVLECHQSNVSYMVGTRSDILTRAKTAAKQTWETQLQKPFGAYIGHLRNRLQTEKFASKGDRTRFRLELATIECLEASSYNELKVAEICKAAGVALGTFYVYYNDKAEIACHAMLEFGDALIEHGRASARGGNDYEAIFRTNRHYINAYRSNASLLRCMVQLEDQVPAFRDAWYQKRLVWIERVTRSIKRRSALKVKKDVLIQTAYALDGMVSQYLFELFVKREPMLTQYAGDENDIADVLSVLWYRAIYREDPPNDQVRRARTNPEELTLEPIQSED